VSAGTVAFGPLTVRSNFFKVRCFILLDLSPEVLVANLKGRVIGYPRNIIVPCFSTVCVFVTNAIKIFVWKRLFKGTVLGGLRRRWTCALI
jgi:hypothetical protein